MTQNAKARFEQIQRSRLLEHLESLLSKLDDPNLDPEKLLAIKAELSECQAQFSQLIPASEGQHTIS